MSQSSAKIHSIDALKAFRLALVAFEDTAQNALVALELEARRPVVWVENDRGRYWPQQERIASDKVLEARGALEKCELTSSSDERRYCYDERKLLEKAKRRWRLTEEKVDAVRRWKMQIRKESQEFFIQVSKLKRYLETDYLVAIAALERMTAALDHYAQSAQSPRDSGSSSSG